MQHIEALTGGSERTHTTAPWIQALGIDDIELSAQLVGSHVIDKFESAGLKVNAHKRAGRTKGFVLKTTGSKRTAQLHARAKPRDLLKTADELLSPELLAQGIAAMLDVLQPLAGTETEFHVSRVDLASDMCFPARTGREFIRSLVDYSTEIHGLRIHAYCDWTATSTRNRISNIDWRNGQGRIEWRLYDRAATKDRLESARLIRLERQVSGRLSTSTTLDEILELYDGDKLIRSVPSRVRFGTPSLLELQEVLASPLHVDRAYAYFCRENEFGMDGSYPLTAKRRKIRNDQRRRLREKGIDPDSGQSSQQTLKRLINPWAPPWRHET